MNASPVIAHLVSAVRVYKRFVSPVSFIARRFIARAGRDACFSVPALCCLDLGAGTAPYEFEICESFSINHYIPVDLLPTKRTKLIADACQLPIPDGQIHLAVAFDVIQHVPDPERMLDEIARVLLPNGYVLLTFPFLYPECDAHDFRRWTMEGMTHELKSRGFEMIHADRRGGRCFAVACAITWAIQHLIPGQRRGWRASRSWPGVMHAALVMALTLPVQPFLWLALGIDYFLPSGGYYMGGAVFARKIVRQK